MMIPVRVFCIAAAFGELGKGGWLFSGPWVAPLPEIASAQAVATYMQQHPEVAQLPLTAISVSEVPVNVIRSWLDGIDKAVEAEKLAQAEKVLPWPVIKQPQPEVMPNSSNHELVQGIDKTEAPSSGGADPPEPAA